MRKTGQAHRKITQVDGRTLAERVAGFLREQHPLKTAQCVEAETGVSAHTVRKWLEQGNAPSGPAYDALVNRYGAPFLCRVHPDRSDAWFVDVARQQEQQRLERAAATIRQQLAAVMGGR
ncbi:hypothetical protein [Methylobacterium planeticum]|uniref:Uncharacterized protein n=1 Tax=Methylobacterium planeticum TaxID=2615211 RepID=A0A6N6MDR7_9HYPH|nr:hypothetical protein [Methylobacterium planeticum]KAB1068878.1 hypothetical protein F6X51_26100 [Methylobacterium planeticum]